MTNKQIVTRNDENGIAVVTINNPPVNALSSQVIDELEMVVDELAQDSVVQSVVITGEGNKAFVAGADIQQFPYMTPESGYELARKGQKLYAKIGALDQPVIAAINGLALGGGCELAMACDIRVGAENAKFGQPEVNLGIIPGYGGTQRLPRLVGSGKALLLILTGDMIDAQEAYRSGLIDVIAPKGEATNIAIEICKKIQVKAPLAIKASKKAVHEGLALSLSEGIELEAKLFKELCKSEDQKEGARAFLAKEKPQFKGK